jgi:hypothetical protein
MPERYGKTAFMALLEGFHEASLRTYVRYELFLHASQSYGIGTFPEMVLILT